MNRTRRRVMKGLAASMFAAPAGALATARVIIIGAGFGGATCAKYLKLLAPSVDVLLLDARATFMTGPFSNLVVAGLQDAGSITRRSSRVAASHGVRFLQARVREIDPVSLRVTTSEYKPMQADRLVVAPGIAMRWDLTEGLDARTSAAAPHAWLGDGQVLDLRRRLDAAPDGAVILISAPPNPYRCPPGPYERASLMAHALRRSGRSRAKIIIADSKDDFTQSALCRFEWDERYPGMIEWRSRSSGGEVTRVDTARREVWLRGAARAEKVALMSLIPAQRAADVARQSDLCDESQWCPVNPDSFESLRHPRVHVIGDACSAAPMPKSGFSANSQAKVCAAAVAAALHGDPAPSARLLNTCYSLLDGDAAISVSGYYGAVDGKLSVLSEGSSLLSGGAELRKQEARQARAWYQNITADSFGAR